jgi:hypothetical protein
MGGPAAAALGVHALQRRGAAYFEDRAALAHLEEIDWAAVLALDWRQCKEGKQAEFLLEHSLPWRLVRRIGVINPTVAQQVANVLHGCEHRPTIEIQRGWYY